MMPFIDDEAIRALVALEMDLSGNYLVPTMLGEYYYNKPPLYNWLLLVFFKSFGSYSEFTSRFATVFFLLSFAVSVYYFFKKHFNQKIGILSALALITCGRILFYDALLGLIDICFSWIIFLMFMLVFEASEEDKYGKLFFIAYPLAAIAFLLKGLPAIVFVGFTLIAVLLWKRKIKLLFSWQHILGGLSFVLIVGIYYSLYNGHNSLQNVFTTLITESSKRTAVNYGIGNTVLHVFTFPFEMIYHFLPWSILSVFLFSKRSFQIIRKNSFAFFLVITTLANIWIYWLSVEVYPRYLLMFLPLIFGVLFYTSELQKEHWGHRLLFYLFSFLLPIISQCRDY